MADLNEAQERAAFEAWMKARPGYPFARAYANLMWAAWRARATQQVEREDT